jgi:hypothetical protein
MGFSAGNLTLALVQRLNGWRLKRQIGFPICLHFSFCFATQFVNTPSDFYIYFFSHISLMNKTMSIENITSAYNVAKGMERIITRSLKNFEIFSASDRNSFLSIEASSFEISKIDLQFPTHRNILHDDHQNTIDTG